MGTEVDITEIDWNNPDVNRAFEYFSSRVDVKDRTRQQAEELHSVKEENKNLKEELRSLKAAGHKSRKRARSYIYVNPTGSFPIFASSLSPYVRHLSS